MALSRGYKLGTITPNQLNELLRKRYPDYEAQHLIIIVLWVVVSFDSPPLKSELQYIEGLAASWEIDLNQLFSLVDGNPFELLVATLELISQCLSEEDQRIVLEYCIAASIEDGDLNYDEHMLLRLICDAARISPKEFAAIYRKVTDTDLPELGNPSLNSYYFQMN